MLATHDFLPRVRVAWNVPRTGVISDPSAVNIFMGGGVFKLLLRIPKLSRCCWPIIVASAPVSGNIGRRRLMLPKDTRTETGVGVLKTVSEDELKQFLFSVACFSST